jgi:hypothetical protein
VKKTIIAVLTALFIIILSTGTALGTPKVVLNGNKLAFIVPPRIDNGRTLVPLRTIFESIGATVNWDEDSQTVTAIKGSNTIKLQIGAYSATINDKPVSLDVPGVIVDGRTMVPLRFVSEAMGCKVDWLEETQTVLITDTSSLDPKTSIYCDPKGRFAVTYPKDWFVQTNFPITFLKQQINIDFRVDGNPWESISYTSHPNVVIVATKANQYYSLALIKAYSSNNIKQAFPDSKVISVKDITFDGIPGFEADYSVSVNGVNYISKDLYCLTGDCMFEITTNYIQGEDTDMVAKLNTIANSVQIVDYSK